MGTDCELFVSADSASIFQGAESALLVGARLGNRVFGAKLGTDFAHRSVPDSALTFRCANSALRVGAPPRCLCFWSRVGHPLCFLVGARLSNHISVDDSALRVFRVRVLALSRAQSQAPTLLICSVLDSTLTFWRMIRGSEYSVSVFWHQVGYKLWPFGAPLAAKYN